MKSPFLFGSVGLLILAVACSGVCWWMVREDESEDARYQRDETEAVVTSYLSARASLFRAGQNLKDALVVPAFDGRSIWLGPGSYFLRSASNAGTFFYPVPLTRYRCGPDKDGSFVVAVRPPPKAYPHRHLTSLPDFTYIPSGTFLLGDRLNPREPHYVWLPAYFIAPFEVSNEEFRAFLAASDGFCNPANWTEAGNRWRSSAHSRATALLRSNDPDYMRFGQPDQPVVWVTWYEASAFCKWLTRTIGESHWFYSLPTEAEWEKAARGPDNLDYSLSMSISDAEVLLYNWRKNPGSPVTIVGIDRTRSTFMANRYGLYHMAGNVLEWTQSIIRPYNRHEPYQEDDRNHVNAAGLRAARGGSWYSASIAHLHVSYRDSFQPEHSSQELGFRLVVRPLP